MKRSEALKSIFDFVDRELHIDVEPEDVEKLLNFMKELGFKPPFSKQVYESEVNVYIYPDGNQWEKEDN